jgi:Pyruvate/2-oxoacid:ferredoxin oxidoreductase delta subunit
VAKDKYEIPIPPVQVRFNECTGCQVCARVCTKMTWDAIRMLGTDDFEENYDLTIE